MSLKKEYEENGLLCLENIISIDTIDKINFKIETFKRKNQKFLKDNNLFKDNKLHRVINFTGLITLDTLLSAFLRLVSLNDLCV